MMDLVNNNQFEIKPDAKAKRKIAAPSTNVYLNPALDLLANDDPMCNTGMEIVPIKKRKRTQSCEIVAFENTALDLGISKAAVNEFLSRELENVRKNCQISGTGNKNYKPCLQSSNVNGSTKSLDFCHEKVETEPIYANLNDPSLSSSLYNKVNDLPTLPIVGHNHCLLPQDDVSITNQGDISMVEMDSSISCLEQKSMTISKPQTIFFNATEISNINHTSNIQTNVTKNTIVNNHTNLSLSFIDKLALDSPALSNQSLYLDDDLNESNIMEIKTITVITKRKFREKINKSTNPFLNEIDDDTLDGEIRVTENPFLNIHESLQTTEIDYTTEATNRPIETQAPHQNANLMPRRLFSNDTNSTVSTVNELSLTNSDGQHDYENIDDYRSESPIYENVCDESNTESINKQSKILGYDVTKFSAVDIMNLNRLSTANTSNDSHDSKKDLKHQLIKASNKLSRKVFKTLKKTFRTDKPEPNTTLNPYEVPRKMPKKKIEQKDSGIENPALKLDNSDEIEIEELDDDEEHQYETIKTLRNTHLNTNVTPLKERNIEADSSHNKTSTPGKKVRFDSTLNQEKFITGNSFDCDVQSPGFDVKIDKYQDELENCINERKFIRQNM